MLTLVSVAAVGLGYLAGSGYLTDIIGQSAFNVGQKAFSNDLLNVDFRHSLGGFKITTQFGAAWNVEAGKYHVIVTGRSSLHMAVAPFARPAGAAGIRTEVVEITKKGTAVGAMCLDHDGRPFFGYGFFVEPGGLFFFFRQNPTTGDILRHGIDARIGAVDRVSIVCTPSTNGTVTLTGFANGLQLAQTQDPGGYTNYSLAGLAVATTRVGTEVWFTRVSARVPDESWSP